MIRLRLSFMASVLTLLLAGCTSYQVSGSIPLSREEGRVAIALDDPFGGARLRAALPDAGLSGVFFQQANNGTSSVWRAPDESGLVLYRGILSATYSLGFDLYSADVSDTAELIARRQSGTSTRVHRYLDGENQIVVRAFRCSVLVGAVSSGRYEMREECRGASADFVNSYEVTGSGEIVASQQWVGPEVGYMQIIQLSDGRPVRSGIIAISN